MSLLVVEKIRHRSSGKQQHHFSGWKVETFLWFSDGFPLIYCLHPILLVQVIAGNETQPTSTTQQKADPTSAWSEHLKCRRSTTHCWGIAQLKCYRPCGLQQVAHLPVAHVASAVRLRGGFSVREWREWVPPKSAILCRSICFLHCSLQVSCLLKLKWTSKLMVCNVFFLRTVPSVPDFFLLTLSQNCWSSTVTHKKTWMPGGNRFQKSPTQLENDVTNVHGHSVPQFHSSKCGIFKIWCHKPTTKSRSIGDLMWAGGI